MKPLLTIVSIMTLTASAWAAKPTPNQGPLPKNLASPTYRAPVFQGTPEEFTRKDAKRLAAIAESAADHMKLANYYYRGEAEALDAKGTAYEQAATNLKNGPFVKNLAAPGTAGRWEFAAKGFREEAASNRAIAASHEAMATNAPAGF
jgi:hypothetical protein